MAVYDGVMRTKINQFYLYPAASIIFALGAIWTAARHQQFWQFWQFWFYGAGAVIWGLNAFQQRKRTDA
jgi:hypothetical protein